MPHIFPHLLKGCGENSCVSRLVTRKMLNAMLRQLPDKTKKFQHAPTTARIFLITTHQFQVLIDTEN